MSRKMLLVVVVVVLLLLLLLLVLLRNHLVPLLLQVAEPVNAEKLASFSGDGCGSLTGGIGSRCGQ